MRRLTPGLAAVSTLVISAAIGVRAWNAFWGPRMWGYDAWGHVAYVLFVDLYRSVPYADQGWSYFHPPLHYALGWGFAQLGDVLPLDRGLALLASLASLAIAALAAALTHRVSPDRAWLALLAFGAVAFLPVHLHLSAMPTNELSFGFFAAASVFAFVVNESRKRPRLGGDALVGALLGLALLSKFSGLIPFVALLASLAVRPLGVADRVLELRRVSLRGCVLGATALLLCAPYYARNLVEFGTPFQKSSDFELVRSVESRQPPGSRSLRDYLAFPVRVFVDPDPRAPHMLRSIGASTYASIWADTFRESDTVRTPEAMRRERAPQAWMIRFGVFPTALIVLGTLLALRDVSLGRRRPVYVPLLLLSGATTAAFLLWVWVVPTWAAVRASYLLTFFSLPHALFLARGVEAIADRVRRPWQAAVAPALLAGVALAACVVETVGWVLPSRGDAPATGALAYYYRDYDEARRVFARLAGGAGYPVPWIDNLGAVELADGNPERAAKLSARALALATAEGRPDAYRNGRHAVADAVAGRPGEARDELTRAIALEPHAELLANRGAVQAALGDLVAAEADLRSAVAKNPELAPAWVDLAQVLERAGRPEPAEVARGRALQVACRPPRGYPYGIGTGEILEWGVGRRPLLLWDGQRLWPALPEWFRSACQRMSAASAGRAEAAQ